MAEKRELTYPVQKRWEVASKKDFASAFHPKELRISPVTAQILANRGFTHPDQLRRFLYPALAHLPDPATMKDMPRAVSRILHAIRENEKITLFGDYDVDGTTSVALLYLFLKGCGARVDFYIPHRIQEGYGLNSEALHRIYDQGAKLLITIDCGVSNHDEVRWAMENGLEVIITDHHEVPEILPSALAVINPKQKDCPYPFKFLAGVGVAFNLVIALRSALRAEGYWKENGEPNLRRFLDLVALGTIGDVVPLIGVNRIFAKFGLEELTVSERPGLVALKEITSLKGALVDPHSIYFRLAPRMNAAGRLKDAHEVVRLLICDDAQEARDIASRLDQMNSQRQRIEERILQEARGMMAPTSGVSPPKSIVLSSPDWHPGVIGIVAARLSEEYQRPTILIALGETKGKGSGRSPEFFPLYQGLKACAGCLENFGGHEFAAGLVIRRDRIGEFTRAFERIVQERMNGEAMIPRVRIDTLARLDELDDILLADLDALSPFGPDNPEPVIAMENVRVVDSWKVGNGHLKMKVQEGSAIREAIGFGMAPWQSLARGPLRMAFSPQVNTYQGRRMLQLKIVDWQPLENDR